MLRNSRLRVSRDGYPGTFGMHKDTAESMGKGWFEKQLGGCQNYGPLLGTLSIRCRTIIGIQKGTIILTTTQLSKTSRQAAREELRWRGETEGKATALSFSLHARTKDLGLGFRV